jgi:hypothetical protein
LENADRECVPAEFGCKLERERNEARQQLRIAVGLLSTHPQFADTHPEDVLAFVKEGARCPVCSPEQKCWECADDVSQEGEK